jgi:choline dehydrogenase-like flavoprotein
VHDVIVIGSGPAGVSASFPLLAAGMRVLMIDGGGTNDVPPPEGSYLEQRAEALDQSDWMVGAHYHALRAHTAASPKLRTPTHETTFAGFATSNRIHGEGFTVVGSLAAGGLSNAWGCGVAALSPAELSSYPVDASDMRASYATVARRMGMSGAIHDDLKDYFAIDEWAQPPVVLDGVHQDLITRYPGKREALRKLGFRLGRSRVAALSSDRGSRLGCDLSGTCLWGCHRDALYSSTQDLQTLRASPLFTYRPGFIADRIVQRDSFHEVHATDTSYGGPLHASRVILAAGTLASTAIAMRSLASIPDVRVQTSPTAAFLLWVPRRLGAARRSAFGLGQLSFTVDLGDKAVAFGSTFSPTGLPVSEFLRHLPLSRRFGIDLLGDLMSSCIVGNLFLPGRLSDNTASMRPDGSLLVRGRSTVEAEHILGEAQKKIGRAFRSIGAWLIPRSFTAGAPGTDIHYAASLPMVFQPRPGQCDHVGQLSGMAGVYVADGASLSELPAKSHTLTIMANADRIGRAIAKSATP